jgi:GH35 family endo-1,4-beta-xylanase
MNDTQQAEIVAMFDAFTRRDFERAFSYAHNLTVWGWQDGPHWLQKARRAMQGATQPHKSTNQNTNGRQ